MLFSSHVISELERVADYLILLTHGQVQMAGEIDDLLAGHTVLSGPAKESGALTERFPVVQSQLAGRHAQLLVRTNGSSDPPAGWESDDVSLEELVLSTFGNRPRRRCRGRSTSWLRAQKRRRYDHLEHCPCVPADPRAPRPVAADGASDLAAAPSGLVQCFGAVHRLRGSRSSWSSSPRARTTPATSWTGVSSVPSMFPVARSTTPSTLAQTPLRPW